MDKISFSKDYFIEYLQQRINGLVHFRNYVLCYPKFCEKQWYGKIDFPPPGIFPVRRMEEENAPDPDNEEFEKAVETYFANYTDLIIEFDISNPDNAYVFDENFGFLIMAYRRHIQALTGVDGIKESQLPPILDLIDMEFFFIALSWRFMGYLDCKLEQKKQNSKNVYQRTKKHMDKVHKIEKLIEDEDIDIESHREKRTKKYRALVI